MDAELGKLSPKLRDILVLCLLEGMTAEEASQQLACPVGTVKSRLARGREALRGGLTARGLAPSVALAVVAGTPQSALASPVSRALSLSTVRIATLVPEHIPQAVVALTKGMTTSMLHKSSVLAAGILRRSRPGRRGDICLAKVGCRPFRAASTSGEAKHGPRTAKVRAPHEVDLGRIP